MNEYEKLKGNKGGVFDELYTSAYDEVVRRILDEEGRAHDEATASDELKDLVSNDEALPGSEEFVRAELERFEEEVEYLRSLGVLVRIRHDDLEVMFEAETGQYYIDSASPRNPEQRDRIYHFECNPRNIHLVSPIHIPTSLRSVDLLTTNNVPFASVPEKVERYNVHGKGIEKIVLPQSLDTLIIDSTSVSGIPPLPDDLESLAIQFNKKLTTLPTLPASLVNLATEKNNSLNYSVDQLPVGLKKYSAYDKGVYTFTERRRLKKKMTAYFEPIGRRK